MWKFILFACLFVDCAHCVSIKCTNSNASIVPDSVVWDGNTNSAYYVDYGVDSQEPCLFRYDAGKKRTYSAYVKGPSYGSPGFIIPIKSGRSLRKFAVGFKTFVGIVAWDGKSRKAQLLDEIFNARDTLGPNERIYVGHRDETGHSLYAGTLSLEYCGVPANQSVYLKQRGSERTRVLTDLKSSVGYAFANGLVYILDACTLKLWAIPDPNAKCKSKCAKERVAFDFTNIAESTGNFVPFGLEADSKGILYTANYYDGCIYAVDPVAGKAKKVAQLPVKGPTSISFGGDNGNGQDMYVAVASRIRDLSTGQISSTQDPGCALYKVKGLGSGNTFKRLKV